MKKFVIMGIYGFVLWLGCSQQKFSSDSPTVTDQGPRDQSGKSSRSSLDAKAKTPDDVDASNVDGNQRPETSVDAENSGSSSGHEQDSLPVKPIPDDTGNKATPNTAQDGNIVQFHIKAGTGRGAWNTPDNPIVVKVGQTLEVVNDDSTNHWIHTDFRPFFHPFSGIQANGGTAQYTINTPFSGQLHDHSNGGQIYLKTE